jgi:hypothetical protein
MRGLTGISDPIEFHSYDGSQHSKERCRLTGQATHRETGERVGVIRNSEFIIESDRS